MGKNQDPGSGINIPVPPHWFLRSKSAFSTVHYIVTVHSGKFTGPNAPPLIQENIFRQLITYGTYNAVDAMALIHTVILTYFFLFQIRRWGEHPRGKEYDFVREFGDEVSPDNKGTVLGRDLTKDSPSSIRAPRDKHVSAGNRTRVACVDL